MSGRTISWFLAASLIISAFVVGLGVAFFISLMEMDKDLVYMGVYFEDLAGNLTAVNASQDAVDLAYGVSGRFCAFYEAQMKVMGENLASNRYAPACNVSLKDTEEAMDIKAGLRKSPPLFGLVFNYEPKNRECSRNLGMCGNFVPANKIPWW